MANWQRDKNIYILFGQLYSSALYPYRDLGFLKHYRNYRILEYGCSHAPYYRAYRQYFFRHIKAVWHLADILNISFLYSQYTYMRDPWVEKFITINTDNLWNPLYDVELKYDVIILTTVLEHVHSPLAVIELLTGYLQPGGLLLFDYIKSDALGLDSAQGLSQRMDTLQYIKQNYTILQGDFTNLEDSIGLCLGKKNQ
jgi:SAM-dependent methyltransferase